MKQGINFRLSVRLEMDIDTVEAVDFIFKNDSPNSDSVEFHYPSSRATLNDVLENTINLHWSEEETWKFPPEYPVFMDTKIHMHGKDHCPVTPIVRLQMGRTLFDREEDTNG